MRESGCWKNPLSPWAARGSKKYLWTEQDLIDAIAYVLEGQLYYVLAHDKPERYGEDEFSNFVLLFAVGVSPATGNLVGAVTHQVCHNLCD